MLQIILSTKNMSVDKYSSLLKGHDLKHLQLTLTPIYQSGNTNSTVKVSTCLYLFCIIVKIMVFHVIHLLTLLIADWAGLPPCWFGAPLFDWCQNILMKRFPRIASGQLRACLASLVVWNSTKAACGSFSNEV